MKKLLEIASLAIVMLAVITTVNATWVQKYDLNYKTTKILADNLEGNLHSTLRSLDMNKDCIHVQNDIKRMDGNKWTTRASQLLIITEVNKNYHTNATLEGKAVTRSYWENQTSGSTINCNLYIDPGHMAN